MNEVNGWEWNSWWLKTLKGWKPSPPGCHLQGLDALKPDGISSETSESKPVETLDDLIESSGKFRVLKNLFDRHSMAIEW